MLLQPLHIIFFIHEALKLSTRVCCQFVLLFHKDLYVGSALPSMPPCIFITHTHTIDNSPKLHQKDRSIFTNVSYYWSSQNCLGKAYDSKRKILKKCFVHIDEWGPPPPHNHVTFFKRNPSAMIFLFAFMMMAFSSHLWWSFRDKKKASPLLDCRWNKTKKLYFILLLYK